MNEQAQVKSIINAGVSIFNMPKTFCLRRVSCNLVAERRYRIGVLISAVSFGAVKIHFLKLSELQGEGRKVH